VPWATGSDRAGPVLFLELLKLGFRPQGSGGNISAPLVAGGQWAGSMGPGTATAGAGNAAGEHAARAASDLPLLLLLPVLTSQLLLLLLAAAAVAET